MGRQAGKMVDDVVGSAIKKDCTFVNDTEFEVEIVDYDSTRKLRPGYEEDNWLITGLASVDIVLKFPHSEEAKINFPASKFENRRHKISYIFRNEISEFKSKHNVSQLNVIDTYSKWHLAMNHGGGYKKEENITKKTKHNWKTTQSSSTEFEAKVAAKVEAIEASTSFKMATGFSRVTEYEDSIETGEKRWFEKEDGPLYIWQEIVVVVLDEAPPFNELEIPTIHEEVTSTKDDPGNEKFMFSKK